MTWVKEANKLGKYIGTYGGFRMYYTIEPSHTERIEEREDGQYRVVDFQKGQVVAIDKHGRRKEGDRWSVISWCQFEQQANRLGGTFIDQSPAKEGEKE